MKTVMNSFRLTTSLCLWVMVTMVAGDYPFNDPALSWDERVEDLVARLTVDEMTQQMAMGGQTEHPNPLRSM